MKLLNKTASSYLIGSLVILVISLPIFYFGINYFLLRSVDKSLAVHLNEIRLNLSPIQTFFRTGGLAADRQGYSD